MRRVIISACVLGAIGLLLFACSAAFAAPAVVKKSVQQLENGNYLIKLSVMAQKADIYGFELKDPRGTIIDVYAPKGWCMLTDGEICLSRTAGAPIDAKKGIEFVIHATSPDVQYVWTFFDQLKQLGKPEVL